MYILQGLPIKRYHLKVSFLLPNETNKQNIQQYELSNCMYDNFKWIKANDGIEENEIPDSAAKSAAEDPYQL